MKNPEISKKTQLVKQHTREYCMSLHNCSCFTVPWSIPYSLTKRLKIYPARLQQSWYGFPVTYTTGTFCASVYQARKSRKASNIIQQICHFSVIGHRLVKTVLMVHTSNQTVHYASLETAFLYMCLCCFFTLCTSPCLCEQLLGLHM